MEYKVILTVAVAFTVFQSAHSLRCYSCSSLEPDQTCASPLDTDKIPSKECNSSTAQSLSKILGNLQDIDQNLLKSAEDEIDFQCVVYEKLYHGNNRTETVRNCIKQKGLCGFLNGSGGHETIKYNLTRCEVCTTENCNSGTNLNVSAFLFIVFILAASLK